MQASLCSKLLPYPCLAVLFGTYSAVLFGTDAVYLRYSNINAVSSVPTIQQNDTVFTNQ